MTSSSHAVPPISTARLITNYALLLTAPLPATALARHWLASGVATSAPFTSAAALLAASFAAAWVVSVLQRNTWLIDPYWTLVPPLLDAFWRHACAATPTPRATLWSALLLLWAIRLTHNYVRREGGLAKLGAREDWRYEEMSKEWGRLWPLIQVVPVYVVQHALLMGIASPFCAMRCGGVPFWKEAWGAAPSQQWWRQLITSAPPPAPLPHPWHPVTDMLAISLAITGLALAAAADNQLYHFCATTSRRDRAAVLATGVWAWSRHPNYVGETLWWVGAATAGWAAMGATWPLAGVALNTACLLAVTRMTEDRTAAAPGRRKAWETYCARTPCWVGWRRG